jgi:hypothetical protein
MKFSDDRGGCLIEDFVLKFYLSFILKLLQANDATFARTHPNHGEFR